jgi:hypothetical protein
MYAANPGSIFSFRVIEYYQQKRQSAGFTLLFVEINEEKLQEQRE